MVKKIQGNKPGAKTSSATPVQPTKTVESAKVGGVDKVQSTEQSGQTGKTVGPTTKISPEMREHIMRLIEEEAEKMFGGEDGLPEERKKTVKGAVRMAIDAGMTEDE